MSPEQKHKCLEELKVFIKRNSRELYRLMTSNGLSVKDVAFGSNLSVGTIYNLLNGKTNITDNTATKLGAFFKTGKAFWFKNQYSLDEQFVANMHRTEYKHCSIRWEVRTIKMIKNYFSIRKKVKLALKLPILRKIKRVSVGLTLALYMILV